MDPSPLVPQPSANGPGGEDIRRQLRRDHEMALAELELLQVERDERRCQARLHGLRRAWIIHALAEETVVYGALESAQASIEANVRSNERLVHHEIVDSLFDKLSRSAPRSLEWRARVNVVHELIARYVQAEEADLSLRLAREFDATALAEMGRRFVLARDKLTLLEQARAA